MDNPFTQSKNKPAEEPKKKGFGGSLFGKHETQVSAVSANDISNQLNNLSRRLRTLEERYTNLRKNTQLTDQNIIQFNKNFNREITTQASDINDLRREFDDLREKARLIVKELVGCAKSEDVKTLERYVNLWDPIHFVQRTEVEKIVEDKIKDIIESKDLKE